MSVIGTTLPCPICRSDLIVQIGAMVGELVECGDCAGMLEVVSMSPPLVAIAPEVEEDWGE